MPNHVLNLQTCWSVRVHLVPISCNATFARIYLLFFAMIFRDYTTNVIGFSCQFLCFVLFYYEFCPQNIYQEVTYFYSLFVVFAHRYICINYKCNVYDILINILNFKGLLNIINLHSDASSAG